MGSSEHEQYAGNDLLPNNAGPVPAQAGSSEYVGTYMQTEHANQNYGVSTNQTEQPLPPVSSDVHNDYQNGNKQVFDVPQENTRYKIVDQPAHQQTFEEQPMIDHTVPQQAFEEQPVHPVTLDDQVVLPTQSWAHQAPVEVKDNVQGADIQQDGYSDLGVMFEGNTYGKRVFDENLNQYVYVQEDSLQPRGGLVM